MYVDAILTLEDRQPHRLPTVTWAPIATGSFFVLGTLAQVFLEYRRLVRKSDIEALRSAMKSATS